MLRIGITCYPSHGGSGVVATELGKTLAKNGHDIHFITYEMPFRLKELQENIWFHPVKLVHHDLFQYPSYDAALANCMARVARDYHLDILHVHYAMPHAVSAVIAKQIVGPSLKVVTTVHGTDITLHGINPALKEFIKFGLTNSDQVTAVSDWLVQRTQSNLNVKDLRRIYNFVDEKVYLKIHKRRQLPRTGEKVIVHISNYRTVKRARDVLSIFRRINEKIGAKLLLVGEGPELSQVKEEVNRLSLASNIHFLGNMDEVFSVLSMADVLILPSDNESFGLAALEAMACGVPVVATAVGGLREVIKDTVTGFLSSVGDIEKMTQDTIALLRDDHLYKTVSISGVNRVATTFSSDQIVKQYEDVYYKVLREGKDLT